MLMPNKLFTYEDSVMSKLPVVIKELQKEPVTVKELYRKTGKSMENVNEFIDVLDCLYILNRIRYDEEKGVLVYVV